MSAALNEPTEADSWSARALALYDAGYTDLFPLPARQKGAPPNGWTGRSAKRTRHTNRGMLLDPRGVPEWRQSYSQDANIGWSLPDWLVALDDDGYKSGKSALEAFQKAHGLPDLPAVPRNSPRSLDAVLAGCGHRLFRVPPGLTWTSGGDGFDLIHAGLRYLVMPGSVHPQGGTYRWVNGDGTAVSAPDLNAIPDLPAEWVRALTKPTGSDPAAVGDVSVGEWLNRWLPTDGCKAQADWGDEVKRLLWIAQNAINAGYGSRHDTARDTVYALAKEGVRGVHGARAAINALGDVFVTAVAPERDSEEAADEEWNRILTGLPDKLSEAECLRLQDDGRANGTLPEGGDDLAWPFVDGQQFLDGDYKVRRTEVVSVAGGDELFYVGAVNGIHGTTTAGKSILFVTAAAQVIRAGGVAVLIDFEDSPSTAYQRMCATGLSREQVLSGFAYVSGRALLTDRTSLDTLLAGIAAKVAANGKPSIVGIDTVGESLAIEGLNDNYSDEVANWFQAIPRRIARLGAAVVLLDHVTKSSSDSLFAQGSQRKLAAIDGAAYLLENREPFSQEGHGYSSIKVAKDRHGTHPRGEVVGALYVEPTSLGPLGRLVTAQSASNLCVQIRTNPEDIFKSAATRAVRAAGKSLTTDELMTAVKATGTRLRKTDRSAGLRELVDGGYLSQSGSGKAHDAHRYAWLRDYNEPLNPTTAIESSNIEQEN